MKKLSFLVLLLIIFGSVACQNPSQEPATTEDTTVATQTTDSTVTAPVDSPKTSNDTVVADSTGK